MKDTDLSVKNPHGKFRASDVTKVDPNSRKDLIPLILQTYGLTKLQINSFNDFIESGLERIMNANREVVIKKDTGKKNKKSTHKITYTRIYVGKPETTPQQCRLSDQTYAADVKVDYILEYRESDGEKKEVLIEGARICRLPIMLQSCRCNLYNCNDEEYAKMDECRYDPGGYFIINGAEKIVHIQEQAPYNRILIENTGRGTKMAVVNSSTDTHKVRIEVNFEKDLIALHHNMLREDIPIFVIFRALGVLSDQEALQLLDPTNKVGDLLMPSLQKFLELNIATQEKALEYIVDKIRDKELTGINATEEEKKDAHYTGKEFMRSMVLPHISCTFRDFRRKIIFLACMCRWLIFSVRNERIVDKRDFFGNKKLELAGELIDLLFEDLFKKFNDNLRKDMDGNLITRERINTKEAITNGLINAISSGNWTITRFRMDRAGVSQPLGRMSYLQFVSMITRISSHFEKTQKVAGARLLYPSQFGFICPSDTPEGAQCGLIKNVSLTAHVTIWSDPSPARKLLYNLGVEDVVLYTTGEEIHNNFIIMLNGEPIGIYNDPVELCRKFRKARRYGWIDKFTAIWTSYEKRCIFICSEAGRACRPLIIVEDGKSKLTEEMMDKVRNNEIKFEYFLNNAIIEYVDINETHDCLIAFKDEDLLNTDIQYTHLEIDNAQMIGVCAGVVPCPHHNQSPRNTYQCAMGKQAVGPTALNIMNRVDKATYFNCYPQMPMVQTRTIRYSRYHEMPCGQNGIVAIMSYSGYDIEDALIMNRASLDRGYGRRYYLSKLDFMFKNFRKGRFNDIILTPKIDKIGQRGDCLDIDGLVSPGIRITNNKIFLNKHTLVDTGENSQTFEETTCSYKSKYPVVIKNVSIFTKRYENQPGIQTVIKIKTSDFRRPELGDKFSSRHGQKGTVGLIVQQEDMPFNERGISPDMIMNPHGFPSRMTVGKLIELVSGKAGIFNGRFGNGTAFSSDRVTDIAEDLIKAGYSYSGKDLLMSGITGEPMQAYIFFGPVFYQSLKHMVKDKMQARANGSRTKLTRQPTQGRNKGGGMRLGEMERDCIIGYGAASFLYERMLLSSDLYEASVCSNCGFIGSPTICVHCRTNEHMKPVKLPYACKLLFYEMMSMGVVPKINVRDI